MERRLTQTLQSVVIVRLNRASAAQRDQDRSHGLPPTQAQDETCLKLWREMIGQSILASLCLGGILSLLSIFFSWMAASTAPAYVLYGHCRARSRSKGEITTWAGARSKPPDQLRSVRRTGFGKCISRNSPEFD